jgi:hypothetical protein
MTDDRPTQAPSAVPETEAQGARVHEAGHAVLGRVLTLVCGRATIKSAEIAEPDCTTPRHRGPAWSRQPNALIQPATARPISSGEFS